MYQHSVMVLFRNCHWSFSFVSQHLETFPSSDATETFSNLEFLARVKMKVTPRFQKVEQVGLDEKFGMHIFGFAVAEGLVVHCYHIQRAKTCVLPVLTSSFVLSRQSGRAFLMILV